MTIAFWCVLIAIFLPYVCTSIAKFGGEGYGGRANADPRAFLGSLEGFRRRANNAQLNAFEVTPAFAAAVIIAHLVGNASQATLDSLAIAWITSRLLYVICYLADWGAVALAGLVRRHAAHRRVLRGFRLSSPLRPMAAVRARGSGSIGGGGG
ncbi:membrane protein [Pseudomonas aeruginosa]|nr:membrane protein [Pseudomonas aeruginosa]